MSVMMTSFWRIFAILCIVLLSFASVARGMEEEESFHSLVAAADESISSNVDYHMRALKLLQALPVHDGAKRTSHKYMCSTFVKWNDNSEDNLSKNILKSENICDWFVIVYDSNEKTFDEMEQSLHNKMRSMNNSVDIAQFHIEIVPAPSKEDGYEVFHKLCDDYFTRMLPGNNNWKATQCGFITNTTGLPYNAKLYSKGALMMLLLPYLPKYEYAWLLDGDLTFEYMHVPRWKDIHQCAFEHIPVITQPLIHEQTQFYRYLHAPAWKNSYALASEVGFIEIQAPLFNARYLEWFLTSCIIPLLPAMHILGADWGLDELFCTTAKEFLISQHRRITHARSQKAQKAQKVSVNESSMSSTLLSANMTTVTTQQPRFFPCAIIVDQQSIHHVNNGEIANSVGGIEMKRRLNFAFMHLVHRVFGRFAHNGLQRQVDPFNKDGHFKKIYTLRDDCDRF